MIILKGFMYKPTIIVYFFLKIRAKNSEIRIDYLITFTNMDMYMN